MKNKGFTILVLFAWISGCQSVQQSTTIQENSSTSFIDLSNQMIDFSPQIDLNRLNNEVGLTPSTGDVNILLVPIHFKDVDDSILDVSLLQNAFNGKKNEQLEWYSVKEFYQLSSYGKCQLDFTMTDVFIPSQPAQYYNEKYNNNNYLQAVESLLEEAMISLEETYDLNQFDANQDGYIDGIYFVYDYPVDYTYANHLWWAFTSYYQKEENFDQVKMKSYVFAGYDFLKQNNENCNTHTFIHEMAHMFGLDDYYDAVPSLGSAEGGLAGGDLMDGTIGDHNAFSKALLNWNQGKRIQVEESLTIQLSAFEENGDYLLFANDFDNEKGLFQEFYLLEYYTPTLLYEYDKPFSIPGIRILHIVGDVKKDNTFRFNNSTTTPKLISQITTEDGKTYISSTTKRTDETLFIEKETFHSNLLDYTIQIIELNSSMATLIITKK